MVSCSSPKGLDREATAHLSGLTGGPLADHECQCHLRQKGLRNLNSKKEFAGQPRNCQRELEPELF